MTSERKDVKVSDDGPAKKPWDFPVRRRLFVESVVSIPVTKCNPVMGLKIRIETRRILEELASVARQARIAKMEAELAELKAEEELYVSGKDPET